MWTYKVKKATTFINKVREKLLGFLLQENGAYILTQDGGKIIVRDSRWSNKTKSSTNWSYKTKT